MNVVWILGAGFSKPLGGPLLDDLFSLRLTRILKANIADASVREDLEAAYQAYQGFAKKGLEYAPWRNAEEFLELVELAENGAVSSAAEAALRARSVVEQVFTSKHRKPEDASGLSKRARTYFAAAASVFLDMSVEDGERWQPYRRWADGLRHHDTVVSFNYDLVIERLSRQLSKLKVLLPEEAQDTAKLSAKDTRARGTVDVLKLHGSVDWCEVPASGSGASHVEQPDPGRAILTGDRMPLIATPGPGKKGASGGVLAPLWELACKRLRAADVIVFVGYRFPESDNEAKARLLEAIRTRDSDRPLTAHIVLGADVGAKDPRRLDGLLRWAVSHYTLVPPGTTLTPEARVRAALPTEPPGNARFKQEVAREWNDAPRPSHHAMIWPQPLFAEDFLQVFDRRRLNAWHGFGQSMSAVVDE